MKTKFLTLLIMVLAIACAMTSCFQGQKAPESITLDRGTLKTTYELNETPDFSAVKATITYNDETTETVGSDKLTFSVLDTSTPGKKTVTVTYEGISVTFDVTVNAKAVDGGNDDPNPNPNPNPDPGTTPDPKPAYVIIGAELPQNITSLNGKKAAFLDKTQGYVVGDDNPYIFTLNITVLDENDELVDGVMAYTSASKVYLVDGDNKTLLEGDAIATYVVIDETKNSFDFTEAAIGMTFEIQTRPANNLGIDEEDATCTHTVTVVDGYNVYDTKELNFLTNDTDAEFGPEDEFVQVDIVNAYLAANGLVRPEKLAGIVLHGDHVITKADLPAGYFTPADAGDAAGYLYDFFMVYRHALTADVPTFSIYGNYYTIDSKNIPQVPPKNDAYNSDGISNSALFMFSVDQTITDTRNSDGTAKQPGVDADAYQNYDPANYVTNVINLALRDNEPNSNMGDEAFLDASKRGLIAFKTRFNTVNITNTRAEAYMISLLTDYDHQVVNLNKVDFYNAWQNHIFASSKNLLWERNDAYDLDPNENYLNAVINITDSRVAKCGGPVIISQTDGLDDESCTKSKTTINIDDATEIWSYVNGTEPWFQAYGVTDIVTMVLGMSSHIENVAKQAGINAGFVTKVGENTAMNLIMVNMTAGMGLSLNPGASPDSIEDVDGKLTVGGNTVMNMNDGENPMVDTYVNGIYALMQQIAPVFQTSAGGTCASNGTDSVFGIESGAPGAPTAECFQGEYITLYYLGIAITFEYYNPTNPA